MEQLITGIIFFMLGWLIGNLTNKPKRDKKYRPHPSDHG